MAGLLLGVSYCANLHQPLAGYDDEIIIVRSREDVVGDDDFFSVFMPEDAVGAGRKELEVFVVEVLFTERGVFPDYLYDFHFFLQLKVRLFLLKASHR